MLDIDIKEDWEPEVREAHRNRQQQIAEDLVTVYGAAHSSKKMQNFRDLGPREISVVAYHNVFIQQARSAFIIGAYYPALTAACALGERILNHLVIELRESFKGTAAYKRVYRKGSFDDWSVAISALESWKVLLPEVVADFDLLKRIRMRSIHLDPRNPVTEQNARSTALEAIQVMGRIIFDQFGAFGPHPWFILDIAGASYIRKEWENHPFIGLVYLPNSALVGCYHRLEFVEGVFVVHDPFDYDNREISDTEFQMLLAEARKHSNPNTG